MDFNQVVEFLGKDDAHWSSSSSMDVELPFDILPSEYLCFVEDDLKKLDKRNLVNALSNAKRSLDCQIEALLYAFCLRKYANNKKFNIPQKIALLNDIGIIAPRILKKINKIRNMMEHEFSLPMLDDVQDFADVILLFNHYTDKYLYNAMYKCQIVDHSDEIVITPTFDMKEQNVIIGIYDEVKTQITVDANDPLFISFLQLYINILD